jgi:Arc/MetJ family transcription regulator
MTRTNIDIDDDLVEAAMRKYGLKTKKDAVDLGLRRLVGTPVTKEFLLSLRGMGWEGDLDQMRDDRVELLP